MKPIGILKRYIALLVVIIVPAAFAVAWLRSAASNSRKADSGANQASVAASPSAQVTATQQNAVTKVTIDNFTFTPKVVTVPKGTVVQWINNDDIPHVIASADKKFKKSPPLDTDQSFSHTFSEPGAYEYFCAIHARMTGTVIVK